MKGSIVVISIRDKYKITASEDKSNKFNYYYRSEYFRENLIFPSSENINKKYLV